MASPGIWSIVICRSAGRLAVAQAAGGGTHADRRGAAKQHGSDGRKDQRLPVLAIGRSRTNRLPGRPRFLPPSISARRPIALPVLGTTAPLGDRGGSGGPVPNSCGFAPTSHATKSARRFKSPCDVANAEGEPVVATDMSARMTGGNDERTIPAGSRPADSGGIPGGSSFVVPRRVPDRTRRRRRRGAAAGKPAGTGFRPSSPCSKSSRRNSRILAATGLWRSRSPTSRVAR